VVTERGESSVLKLLLPYTNYSLTVSASTEAGVGVPSEDISCNTLEDGKMRIHDGIF